MKNDFTSNESFEAYTDALGSPLQSMIGRYFERIANRSGEAYCRFIRTIIEKEKFLFNSNTEPISTLDALRNAFDTLVHEHEKRKDSMLVMATVVLAPECRAKNMAEIFESWRQLLRLEYLLQGYTIALTHPQNELGSHADATKKLLYKNEPLWITEMPILMVRKTHALDKPFMNDSVAMRAFTMGTTNPLSIEHWTGPSFSLIRDILRHFRNEKILRITAIGSEFLQVTHEDGFSIFKISKYGAVWDYTYPYNFHIGY